MRNNRIVTAVCLLVLAWGYAAEAHAAKKKTGTTTLYYPTQQTARLALDVPSDWELEQADEEGGFVSVTGPTGIQLSFRTISLRDDDLKSFMEQSFQFMYESYGDVELKEQKDTEDGIVMYAGTGTMKDGGAPVVIVMQWVPLKDDYLAENWLIVDADDDDGLESALKILETIRAR